mmetsp:Transcript_6304/g.17408  ORF Transcript_6304/g.17408 Transcript_6304/m.17408 type:complete len:308 (+) Transcript_6304:198-1121(+)
MPQRRLLHVVLRHEGLGHEPVAFVHISIPYDMARQLFVGRLAGLVQHQEHQVKPGEERRGHLQVLGQRHALVVVALDRVCCGHYSRPCGQRGHETGLCDRDLLLLHHAQERRVLRGQFVKLVYAADAPVGRDDCSSLQTKLAPRLADTERETSCRGGRATDVHAPRGCPGDCLQQAALAQTRVADQQAVNVPPDVKPVGSRRSNSRHGVGLARTMDAAEQGQHQPSLDGVHAENGWRDAGNKHLQAPPPTPRGILLDESDIPRREAGHCRRKEGHTPRDGHNLVSVPATSGEVVCPTNRDRRDIRKK